MKNILWLLAAWVATPALSEDKGPSTNARLSAYFEAETAIVEASSLAEIKTGEDWRTREDEYRRQLREMLGLHPWPDRSPLQVTVTGTLQHPDFTVENLHYQSRPGLYVTANLYLPKNQIEPAPAILYVCGHGKVIIDGVSYGNKVNYQHHAAWFARNGYVCLIIDTLQLGEIEGTHHGTYRHGRRWWNARGYTPAGVEAWNGIRGIDLLQARPEVDSARIGITGRSGGGAYSWWIAALDERVKCAVPVAGITSMRNHIVDGCIEGHCDCMFMVNRYRWDFSKLGALVAPRPLLIANTDKDRIFPLDGVVDVYTKIRRIYGLLGHGEKIGLTIIEGPHKDTQLIRVPAFHWFERHLKGRATTDTIEMVAEKFFEAPELKVFDKFPADELNTTIDEHFVPAAPPPSIPADQGEWVRVRRAWMKALRENIFDSWPPEVPLSPHPSESALDKEGDRRLLRFDLQVAPATLLPLYVLMPGKNKQPTRSDKIVLSIIDTPGWLSFKAGAEESFPPRLFSQTVEGEDSSIGPLFRQDVPGDASTIFAWFSPRGLGPDQWQGNEKDITHIHRRFALLGKSTDSARTWDIRCALKTLAAFHGSSGDGPAITIRGRGPLAGNALYASLFEPAVAELELSGLPSSHHDGPYYLGVLRYFDIPQAVAMAAEKSQIRLLDGDIKDWRFPLKLAERLNWGQEQVRVVDE